MSTEYKWRTINANTVHVDSDMGSDIDGDGTMSKPFQILGIFAERQNIKDLEKMHLLVATAENRCMSLVGQSKHF